jgi:Ulp1 family protease
MSAAPLTPAQEAEVREIFKGSNLQAVLVNKYNVDMTRDKLRSLREGVWLNDEVSRGRKRVTSP